MMPALKAPSGTAGPGQHALAYAAMGWRVLPIKPGEKRPPMSAWQKEASTETEIVRNWFRNLYRGHGVGIATGPESQVWVLDIDTGGGKAGIETLAELEAEHGPLPATVEAVTGSGGRHLYFRWPEGKRVVTRRDTGATDSPLPAGIDVRGEGGQVLAPPTTHPNGTVYAWAPGRSPWDLEVAEAPAWLLDIVCERPTPPPAPAPTDFLANGHRDDDDSIAAWHNARETWDGMLLRDGWTPLPRHGDQQYWVRPGKEKREGHSATLHLPDGPFVVFSTDGSLSRFNEPWARNASGDGWSFSKFGYYAVQQHRGDRSEAARRLREVRTGYERTSVTTETPEVRSRLLRTGAEFVLDQPTTLVPLWGTDDQVLWVRGEPLLFVAPTGVGKTTVAIQLVAARLGITTHVLGLPVADDGDRILYLAMDRPPQIARAMARVFNERHRDVLTERLMVWRGPLPSDLGKNPEALLELCQETTCNTVVIDSYKDAVIKLSDDESAGNLNRAIQTCTVNDVQVIGLHHQRKRISGGEKPKTLDDVYGSAWITAGVGSVVLLWGAAGDPIVELVHLKQPANEVGPWTLEHDHDRGVTTVFHGFDPLAFLKARGDYGATATEAARAMVEKDAVTDNQRKKAQRLLEGLVRRELADKSEPVLGGAKDGQKGSEGARYRYLESGFLDHRTVIGQTGITPGQITGHPPAIDATPISTDTSPDITGQTCKTPGQITGHITGHHRTSPDTPSPDTAPPPVRGGLTAWPEPDLEAPF